MSAIWCRLLLGLLVLFAAGCEFEEVTKQTGYKGKARLNPWLAAERFAERKGRPVISSGSWVKPEPGYDTYFVPVGVLNNAGVVASMKRWILDGGHLVVLLEYSDSEWNDWNEFRSSSAEASPPLTEFLKEEGIILDHSISNKTSSGEIEFNNHVYQVEVESASKISLNDDAAKKDLNFASVKVGYGRLSVLTDARIFRSKNIDKAEHAELLAGLLNAISAGGKVVFLRGAGLSIWNLLGEHLWAILVGLLVALLFWLWKSFARFGPVESASTGSLLRGYDHHLEALGYYQWRLDKGASLLRPLRERIVENAQRAASSVGKRDVDLFQFLAERSGIPRERVVRALSESAPADATILTRTTGDLQELLKISR